MDESNIVLSNDDYEVVENAELSPGVAECFDNVPDVARPLIGNTWLLVITAMLGV